MKTKYLFKSRWLHQDGSYIYEWWGIGNPKPTFVSVDKFWERR